MIGRFIVAAEISERLDMMYVKCLTYFALGFPAPLTGEGISLTGFAPLGEPVGAAPFVCSTKPRWVIRPRHITRLALPLKTAPYSTEDMLSGPGWQTVNHVPAIGADVCCPFLELDVLSCPGAMFPPPLVLAGRRTKCVGQSRDPICLTFHESPAQGAGHNAGCFSSLISARCGTELLLTMIARCIKGLATGGADSGMVNYSRLVRTCN